MPDAADGEPVAAAEPSPAAAEPAAPAAPDAGPVEAPPSATEADVRFVIVPEGFSHTRRFELTTTVARVKALCEGDLRIPQSNMKLVYAGEELHDGQTLEASGLKGGALSQVELQIVYLEERAAPSNYRMPDVVSVEVQFGADIPPKLIQVPIVRAQPEKKPFLGGFRSRKTALEYHHASSQTDPPPRDPNEPLPPPKFHRETQTAVQQTRSQITVREAGTQMERGHAQEEAGDVLITPLPYFDSDMLDDLRLQKAIDVQRYTRGWFARCQAAALRRQQAEEAAALAAAEAAQQREVQERHKREIQRRMHPQTFSDFEVLYNELEAWRLQETKRINEAAADEQERLELLAQLLQKEQKLLQTIDRLRLQASDENRDKHIRWMLQLMSSPKRWQMSDGEVAQVHTPFTTRAKELMELYNGLMLPLLTVDERLDVLLHVKWTVKEFDCNLSRDIVELIDREADMLNRGRSEASLSGLRKRLANLFLQFIETPEFNPEAARFQKVPQELTLRPNVKPIAG
eukprot:Transcript_2683.p1 GENE.Transcript_2683~~Transcript_2683.p1  ORF type:complete len:517 (-),score=265.92 Transcript_2683:76-1626(-)